MESNSAKEYADLPEDKTVEKKYPTNEFIKDKLEHINSNSNELVPLTNAPNCFINEPKQAKQKYYKYIILFLLVIGILMQAIKISNYKNINDINIKDLAQKYSQQEEDFWISFQILVEDTIKYSQPKCLVLLYNDDTRHTIELLLNDLTNYAVCKITSCTSTPIVFEAHEFGEKGVHYDYGKIISQNKAKLIESGVMIVKNLEKVSANSAMAFQSLCDEYQPVVSNVLILLTLKMNQQHEDKYKYVENVLRNIWNDLNDDLFYPLLTRIANFIFVVQKH